MLRIFRLFVGLRLGLLGLTLCSQILQPEPPIRRYPLLGLLVSALLLGYLSWPWLRRQLGRAYLPLALVTAAAAPIVEQALQVGLRVATGVSGQALTADTWRLFLALLVPLLLVSWQYSYKLVVLFSASTALFEVVVMLPLARISRSQYATVFGLVAVRSLLFLLAGYIVVGLMRAQREQHARLEQANRKLALYATTLEQLAVSRERNRLARELHDILAHTLSGVAVQLEATNTLWESDPAAARAMLDQSLGAIRGGLTETRRAIEALRATPLEDLGLILAVRDLAESAAERGSLALAWRAPERVGNLPTEVEQGIYRIAEQVLANVVQHANAQSLTVQIERHGPRLMLTIADDGLGFEPAMVPASGHYGLQGMRERAEMIGGGLYVESQPGQGTTIKLVWERSQ